MSHMDYTRKKEGRGKHVLGVNIIQLLPPLKVNIIIVQPRGVVFPEGKQHRKGELL